MKTLFESIRDYQFEKVRVEPDKALTEDTRVLTDEDLMRWVSVVCWVGGCGLLGGRVWSAGREGVV